MTLTVLVRCDKVVGEIQFLVFGLERGFYEGVDSTGRRIHGIHQHGDPRKVYFPFSLLSNSRIDYLKGRSIDYISPILSLYHVNRHGGKEKLQIDQCYVEVGQKDIQIFEPLQSEG